MQKPLMLLDVDGVANAFQPTRPHMVKRLNGYVVKFDNEVVDMIDALAEHYEIVWATMWNHKANAHIAPALGIDPLPVMVCNFERGIDEAIRRGTPEAFVRYLWYAKTPLIPEYVKGRPFAWVDDDHSWEDEKFLARQPDVTAPFLLHRTAADSGITWEDVAELIAWAQALAAGDLPAQQTTVPASLSDYEGMFDALEVAALLHESGTLGEEVA